MAFDVFPFVFSRLKLTESHVSIDISILRVSRVSIISLWHSSHMHGFVANTCVTNCCNTFTPKFSSVLTFPFVNGSTRTLSHVVLSSVRPLATFNVGSFITLRVTKSIIHEFVSLSNKRLGTHLQDVDGDDPQDNHWVPGQGDLDWGGLRGALSEVKYTGLWTFEAIVGRGGESPDELARLTREVVGEWGLG